MTTWEQWAAGVLGGVGAPVDAANVDTLWGWSNAESGTDVMRWNNPLNTTEPWPGAQNMNSVGVKRYASVNDGILATVATLGNGYYPSILANLRASVSRSQWGNACGELGKWGTGCGWLLSVYGAVPGDIVDAMTQDEFNALVANSPLVNLNGGVTSTYQAVVALSAKLDALLLPGASGGLTAAQAGTLDAMASDIATVKRLIEKDLAP